MKNIYLVFILTFMLSVQLLGQNDTVTVIYTDEKKPLPEIVTDRPDATESSSTVPTGTLQIETGFIYEAEQDDTYKVGNLGMGTTLLRYGVWDNFELRLGSYYQYTTIEKKEMNNDSTQSGLGPLVAGFKVYVIEEKGIRPEIAIVADITLRHVGELDYRPTYSYPKALFAASHTLSEKFSLGYNAGFAYNGENADGFFVYSVALGYSILKKLGFFAEVFGNFDQGNLPNHHLDGGFTYLVRNNLQLDISAGMGFDKDIDKSFISVGLSWRIPR